MVLAFSKKNRRQRKKELSGASPSSSSTSDVGKRTNDSDDILSNSQVNQIHKLLFEALRKKGFCEQSKQVPSKAEGYLNLSIESRSNTYTFQDLSIQARYDSSRELRARSLVRPDENDAIESPVTKIPRVEAMRKVNTKQSSTCEPDARFSSQKKGTSAEIEQTAQMKTADIIKELEHVGLSAQGFVEKPEIAKASAEARKKHNSYSERKNSFRRSMSNYDYAEVQRIRVFDCVAPGVVNVDTYVDLQDIFSTDVMEVPNGGGSGFVWDKKGHVVTNYHVIRDSKVARVAVIVRPKPGENLDINKRKVYKARVVGVDPAKDVAVLKIDATVYDLYPIQLGSSKNLKVGQTALAIGNPFGLDHTLTVGVISGTGREVRTPDGRAISNTIQSDAAINPGNSGGPLLDSSGRVIGMNTAIYSPSGGSAGIGFSVPVETLKYIVNTLIRDGKIVRPVIGISYLQSRQARPLGITKGVLVLDVPDSSPAAKAGLRGTKHTDTGQVDIGDIIVMIDEKQINSETDLLATLESYKPGDKIKITANRMYLNLDFGNSSEPETREIRITTTLMGTTDTEHLGSSTSRRIWAQI